MGLKPDPAESAPHVEEGCDETQESSPGSPSSDPAPHPAHLPASDVSDHGFRHHLRATALTFGAFCAEHPALVALCVVLIAAGCVLRVHDIEFPSVLKWDEHHFVRAARAYLVHGEDRNDHPPLGKLLIAGCMYVWGDNGISWRMPALFAGYLNIGLAFAIGRRVFRNTRAGLLASAFIAADGFLLSYSRAALLDGTLTCLTLCVVWVLVCPVRWWRAVLAFVFAGLAGSIKMTGHALLIPVLAVHLASPLAVWTPGFLVLSPLVFYAQFAVGLAISDLPHSPGAVYNAARKLLAHHLALSDMTHPATSYWFSWALPTRPLMLSSRTVDSDWVRVSSTIGNPLLWWSNVAASVALALKLGWEGPKGTLEWIRREAVLTKSSFVGRHLRGLAVLIMVWGVMILPWIVTARDSYILHYLPSHAVGLVLVGGVLAHVYERFRYLALAYLAVVTLVSAWYAPVWAQLPISFDALWFRLPFMSWR